MADEEKKINGIPKSAGILINFVLKQSRSRNRIIVGGGGHLYNIGQVLNFVCFFFVSFFFLFVCFILNLNFEDIYRYNFQIFSQGLRLELHFIIQYDGISRQYASMKFIPIIIRITAARIFDGTSSTNIVFIRFHVSCL